MKMYKDGVGVEAMEVQLEAMLVAGWSSTETQAEVVEVEAPVKEAPVKEEATVVTPKRKLVK